MHVARDRDLLPSVTETTTWIAHRLRQAREARGWTQADLAQKLGKTQTAISYWESGKRSLGFDELIDAAFLLGRDVDFFLPPKNARQPAVAILRAEVARLASRELEEATEDVLDRVERAGIPPREIEIRATQPTHAANELLDKAGVNDAPVDVKRLAELCGLLVCPSSLPDALSAFLLEVDDGGAIGVNTRHLKVRQRFSIAHELGHHLLGHSERFHIDVSEGGRLDADYASERAANEFAAELLMPRRLVSRLAAGDPGTKWLADRFDVSEIAMGIRLVHLGLR